jgi:hypothetical protein
MRKEGVDHVIGLLGQLFYSADKGDADSIGGVVAMLRMYIEAQLKDKRSYQYEFTDEAERLMLFVLECLDHADRYEALVMPEYGPDGMPLEGPWQCSICHVETDYWADLLYRPDVGITICRDCSRTYTAEQLERTWEKRLERSTANRRGVQC